MIVRPFCIGLAVSVVLFLDCAVRSDDPAAERDTAASLSRASIHEHHHDGESHSRSLSKAPLKSPFGDAGSGAAEQSSRWPLILLGIYSVAIIAASLFGGWVPQRFELTHNGMQMMVSLVGGLMLGIGVFHMLPHALVELGEDGLDVAAYGMMAGLIIMFLMLRLFHFHHHGPADVGCTHAAHHDHDHDGGHHKLSEAYSQTAANRLSWVGVFLGMTLHSLIDGLAVGASVEADAAHGASGLLGVGTFTRGRASQTPRFGLDHVADESRGLVAPLTNAGQCRLCDDLPAGGCAVRTWRPRVIEPAVAHRRLCAGCFGGRLSVHCSQRSTSGNGISFAQSFPAYRRPSGGRGHRLGDSLPRAGACPFAPPHRCSARPC